jgi:hypothetical protein
MVMLPVLLAGTCGAQTRAYPLESRLDGMPIDLDQVPLTRALEWISLRSRENPVLFGAEVFTQHGQEPLVSVHIPGHSTLREALTYVLATLPAYAFEAAAPQLINVFPRAASGDTTDLLNLRIPQFDLTNVPPGNVLNNPARYIPELRTALTHGVPRSCEIGPGLSDKAPGVDVRVKNSTLRGILNAVSEASIGGAQNHRGAALGWKYMREEFPSETVPGHTWRVLGVWRPG